MSQAVGPGRISDTIWLGAICAACTASAAWPPTVSAAGEVRIQCDTGAAWSGAIAERTKRIIPVPTLPFQPWSNLILRVFVWDTHISEPFPKQGVCF